MLVTLGIAAGLSSDTAAPFGAQFFLGVFFFSAFNHPFSGQRLLKRDASQISDVRM